MAASNPTYTITHEDGSAVTPQEVYDAFMSGPVILDRAVNDLHEEAHATSILWAGASPAAVVGVVISARSIQSGTINIEIGDMSGGE